MTRTLASGMTRCALVTALLIVAAYPSVATANSTNSLVPGAAAQVTSITLHVQAMPLECAAMVCATPTPRHRAFRPRTVVLNRRAWFKRFTNDISALPPWQQAYKNGCNALGDDARLYFVVFRYTGGDQWTVTVDRSPVAEMVLARNGDPNRGSQPTCVSPRTAGQLNRDLDQAFSHPGHPPTRTRLSEHVAVR